MAQTTTCNLKASITLAFYQLPLQRRTTEFNRISWNGKEPMYDLCTWLPDHAKMGKSITLFETDIIALSEILKKEVAFLEEEE